MPFEIVWLPDAVRDIKRLRHFIKTKNPLAAKRAASRIIDGVNILKENPEAGMPTENLPSFSDLILPFGSGEYIIRYRKETTHRIVIIRVRHSKEEGF